MRIDLMTLFPEMCRAVLDESIIGRAQRAGAIEIHCTNFRDYTTDKHNRVDDTVYGGGMGMLLLAEPIYQCWKDLSTKSEAKPHTIYMSPKGRLLTQELAAELAKQEHLIILCGHYEGVDERVIEEIADDEISIGDFVLTGGELPACILADAVARHCEGVLASDECFTEESFGTNGLLEYPQYTRPFEWRGRQVPEVLLTGHHANIEAWRLERSLAITKDRRPELYEAYMDAHPPQPEKKKKVEDKPLLE